MKRISSNTLLATAAALTLTFGALGCSSTKTDTTTQPQMTSASGIADPAPTLGGDSTTTPSSHKTAVTPINPMPNGPAGIGDPGQSVSNGSVSGRKTALTQSATSDSSWSGNGYGTSSTRSTTVTTPSTVTYSAPVATSASNTATTYNTTDTTSNGYTPSTQSTIYDNSNTVTTPVASVDTTTTPSMISSSSDTTTDTTTSSDTSSSSTGTTKHHHRHHHHRRMRKE